MLKSLLALAFAVLCTSAHAQPTTPLIERVTIRLLTDPVPGLVHVATDGPSTCGQRERRATVLRYSLVQLGAPASRLLGDANVKLHADGRSVEFVVHPDRSTDDRLLRAIDLWTGCGQESKPTSIHVEVDVGDRPLANGELLSLDVVVTALR